MKYLTRLILVLMLLRLPTALFASHETAVTKGWSNTTERVAMAKPAKAVGMLSSYGNSAALQQERVIRGTVSDQSGELLIGVGVLVHGTLRAVYTDTDGKYEIKVPANRDTLAFKYFGMQDLLVAIGGRDVVNATLKESAQQLEEVVVTGYGDIAKEAYTGSAQVIGAQKISSRSVASFEDALRGLSTGTLVMGGGQPGEGKTMRLRGVGSLEASSQPLIVVDGVVWEDENLSGTSDNPSNILNTLDPSDIANVTLLKDAASASLYGSRGANGVIVITTKREVLGEDMSVSLNLQQGFSRMLYQPDLANGPEYAEVWVEGQMNRLIQDDITQKTGITGAAALRSALVNELNGLYGDKVNYLYDGKNFYEWQKMARSDFNALYQMPTSEGYYRNYDYFGEDKDKLPNTNWFDIISQPAPFTKANLTLRGSGKSIAYYSSFGYYNQQGTILNSELRRYSIRMRASATDRKKLVNWSINNYISYTNQTGPNTNAGLYNSPQYGAVVLPPVIPAKLEDGTLNYHFPENMLNTNHNPLASALLNQLQKPSINISLSGYLRLNINKWLTFRSDAALAYLGFRRRFYYDKDFGTGLIVNGQLTERDLHRTKLVSKNLFFIDKKWGNVHKINITAGTEFETLKYRYIEAIGQGFGSNDLPYLSNAASVRGIAGGGYDWALFSLVSKIDYSLYNKYHLSGSIRRDNSSYFAPEYRGGTFWSVSGAYDLTKERFMRPLAATLSSLKFKGSYGINGTLPRSRASWLESYPTNRYGEAPGVYSSYSESPDLSWEGNRIWNVGVDFSLFRNRVSVTAEYFDRKSKNILYNYYVSMTSGYYTMLRNLDAGIKNSGFEFEINFAAIEKSRLTWDINFNLSTLKSVYYGLQTTQLDDRSRQVIRSGTPLYTWYLKEYGGIDPDSGRILFKAYDEEGNPYLTVDTGNASYLLVGQGLPKVTGGLNSNLTWRNFSFGLLFTYGWGHHIYDRLGALRTSRDGAGNNSIAKSQLDRWSPENTIATSPMRVNYSSITQRTTRFLYKGDYIKLKNVKFEYIIPRSFTNKLKIGRVSTFIQAEDPLIFTYLKDYDPEMSLDGYRNQDQYPTGGIYTIGLNINF